MRIWIDLTNSPHINFFSMMIKSLQKDNDVLLTCRPLANTIDLLEMEGFAYSLVGKHYGRSKLRKGVGFLIRVCQLWAHLKNKNIEVAISHSSFYSPIVARMLGCRCIYLNDNEHAAGNRISFLCANKVMVPEFLSKKKVERIGAHRDKIVQYPGVKEGVYLWSQSTALKQDTRPKNNHATTIFIRPEPWSAQYYKGARNFIDDLLVDLARKYRVFLLPRGNEQHKHYRQLQFKEVHVLKNSIPLMEIIGRCDLFIGAGGTMTRETAVLGIPTISIYQDELLDVDRFLISSGNMVHATHPTLEMVAEMLKNSKRKPPDETLMLKGHQAYTMIKDSVLGID